MTTLELILLAALIIVWVLGTESQREWLLLHAVTTGDIKHERQYRKHPYVIFFGLLFIWPYIELRYLFKRNPS